MMLKIRLYCGCSIRRKNPVMPCADLVNITSSQPMELLCIYFLSLERSKGGHEHILVVTDHFTILRRPSQQETSWLRLQAKYFLKTLLFTLVFLLGSIVIRQEILKVTLSKNFMSCGCT